VENSRNSPNRNDSAVLEKRCNVSKHFAKGGIEYRWVNHTENPGEGVMRWAGML
jgi:hypothetical protein